MKPGKSSLPIPPPPPPPVTCRCVRVSPTPFVLTFWFVTSCAPHLAVNLNLPDCISQSVDLSLLHCTALMRTPPKRQPPTASMHRHTTTVAATATAIAIATSHRHRHRHRHLPPPPPTTTSHRHRHRHRKANPHDVWQSPPTLLALLTTLAEGSRVGDDRCLSPYRLASEASICDRGESFGVRGRSKGLG